MADAMTIKSASGRQADPFGPTDQEIKFCRAPDGVRLAYAIHGSGPPVVVASCWLESSAIRLAEPRLAALPRSARIDGDSGPL